MAITKDKKKELVNQFQKHKKDTGSSHVQVSILTEKINDDIKKAMLAKDPGKLRALRGIKAAILLAQTEGTGNKDLSQEIEVKILQKLLKQRKDSLEIYQKQNRADLAEKEIEEIKVIETYLPAQMSNEDITQVISKIIQAKEVVSLGDMGKIIGEAMKELAGKGDGKIIAEIVKQQLNKNS